MCKCQNMYFDCFLVKKDTYGYLYCTQIRLDTAKLVPLFIIYFSNKELLFQLKINVKDTKRKYN